MCFGGFLHPLSGPLSVGKMLHLYTQKYSGKTVLCGKKLLTDSCYLFTGCIGSHDKPPEASPAHLACWGCSIPKQISFIKIWSFRRKILHRIERLPPFQKMREKLIKLWFRINFIIFPQWRSNDWDHRHGRCLLFVQSMAQLCSFSAPSQLPPPVNYQPNLASFIFVDSNWLITCTAYRPLVHFPLTWPFRDRLVSFQEY